jgi:hypothetical protein
MTRNYIKVRVGKKTYVLSLRDLKTIAELTKMKTPKIPDFSA